MDDKKNDKWVKKGLFWVESPEEKSRVRKTSKIFFIIGGVLMVLAAGSYFVASYYNLKIVALVLLKFFGAIAAIFLVGGLWRLITGNAARGKY